jgi:Kdo2-lipid IVA lauroyltransferase/acyltransferase
VHLLTRTLDARDLRVGGRWSPGQRLKNALIRGLVVALLAVADRLPASWLLAIGRVLGEIAYHVHHAGRARALEALALARPERDRAALARASFRHAGQSLGECLLLRRPDVRALDLVDVDDDCRALLRRVLGPGTGALVVSAHLGPFELVPAAIAELGERPAVVVRESYDPALDPIVDLHRAARGIQVIHRGRPGAALRIVRALGAGRLVGLLPDLGGRLQSVDVNFLGGVRPMPVGPARLARRTGAPLVCLTLGRGRPGGPRYRLQASELDGSGGDLALTQRIAQALESAIVSLPEAWLWMAAPPALDSLVLEKNSGVR